MIIIIPVAQPIELLPIEYKSRGSQMRQARVGWQCTPSARTQSAPKDRQVIGLVNQCSKCVGWREREREKVQMFGKIGHRRARVPSGGPFLASFLLADYRLARKSVGKGAEKQGPSLGLGATRGKGVPVWRTLPTAKLGRDDETVACRAARRHAPSLVPNSRPWRDCVCTPMHTDRAPRCSRRARPLVGCWWANFWLSKQADSNTEIGSPEESVWGETFRPLGVG